MPLLEPIRGRRSVTLTVWWTCAALLFPSTAAAQKDVFVQGLRGLHTALAGTYGDEGAQIVAAIDTMSRGLAQWDRSSAASGGPDPSLLNDAAGDVPAIAHAAYVEAYKLIADGAYDLAIVEFRRAAAADPLVSDPAARTPLMARAGEALRAGRLAEARRHLDAALSLAPASAEARRMLGLVHWVDGQNESSVRLLEAAVSANLRDERSRLALARVLADIGRDEDAERTLRETLDAIPASVLAHWWLAVGYERLNRMSDARREFTLVTGPAVLGGHGVVYASIGRLSRITGDFAGASEAFEHRVKIRPDDPGAHVELAYSYLDQDRLDEALRAFAAAVRLDPAEARAHRGIGRIHLAGGRPGDAADAFIRALALMPDDHEPRYGLAMALKQLGRHAEAARELELFQRAQEQAIANRRAQIARDVLKEGAKLTGGEAAPPAKGAGR